METFSLAGDYNPFPNAGGGGGAGIGLGSIGSLATIGMNIGSAFASGNTGAIAGTTGGAGLGALAGFALGGPAGALLGASLGSSVGGLFGKGGDDDDSATAAYAAGLHASARNIDSSLTRQVEQAKFADAYYPTLLQMAGYSKEQVTSVLQANRDALKGTGQKIPSEVWGAGAGAGITWAGRFAADEFAASPAPEFDTIELTRPYDETFVDYKARHPVEESPEYKQAVKLGERAQDRQFSALGLQNSGKALEARAFLLSDLSAKEDVLHEARQQYGYSAEQTNNLQKRVNEGRIFQQALGAAGLQQQSDIVGQQLDAQQNIVAQQTENAQALQLGTMAFQSNMLDKQLTNNQLMSSLGFGLNSYNADRMYEQNNRLMDIYAAKGSGGSGYEALPSLTGSTYRFGN